MMSKLDMACLILVCTTGVQIMPDEPRGIRNNNPGNIKRTQDMWLHQIVTLRGDRPVEELEPVFVVFAEPKWGLRAMARVLRNYRIKHGISDIPSIIERWSGGDNHTAYTVFVEKSIKSVMLCWQGVDCKHCLMELMQAIILWENGLQVCPYTWAELYEAVGLAWPDWNDVSSQKGDSDDDRENAEKSGCGCGNGSVCVHGVGVQHNDNAQDPCTRVGDKKEQGSP